MLSFIEYYLCCWCRQVEDAEEEDLMRGLDLLEKEFIKYKELKQKKKAEAAKRVKKKNLGRILKLFHCICLLQSIYIVLFFVENGG